MSITTKQEVLEVLEMSDEEFAATIMPEAEKAYMEQDGRIIVRSMVGYSFFSAAQSQLPALALSACSVAVAQLRPKIPRKPSLPTKTAYPSAWAD